MLDDVHHREVFFEINFDAEKKLQFSGKMPQKCSNDALCFRLTKISPKDARMMYKSQASKPLIKAQIFELEGRRFEKLCLPLEKSGFTP